MDMATESNADHLNICLTMQENTMDQSHLHTHVFRSMLPSWKHALLTSFLSTETVIAPFSSPNQDERSFSKITTAKSTGSSPFPYSSTTGLNVTESKGGP